MEEGPPDCWPGSTAREIRASEVAARTTRGSTASQKASAQSSVMMLKGSPPSAGPSCSHSCCHFRFSLASLSKRARAKAMWDRSEALACRGGREEEWAGVCDEGGATGQGTHAGETAHLHH